MKVVIELTLAESRALLAAAGNSLGCDEDAESICGRRGKKFAYEAAAKLRMAIAKVGGYKTPSKTIR